MSLETPFEQIEPMESDTNIAIANHNKALRAIEEREAEWQTRHAELRMSALDRCEPGSIERLAHHRLVKAAILRKKRDLLLQIAKELPPLIRESRRQNAQRAKEYLAVVIAHVHDGLAQLGFSPSSAARKKPFDAHRLVETTNIHDEITDARNELKDAERLAAAPVNFGHFETAVENIEKEIAIVIAA